MEIKQRTATVAEYSEFILNLFRETHAKEIAISYIFQELERAGLLGKAPHPEVGVPFFNLGMALWEVCEHHKYEDNPMLPGGTYELRPEYKQKKEETI